MTDVLMPRLSESMEQGTIITWLKAAGTQIEAGDELLEIETDKATVTYAAEVGGLLEILAPVGRTVAVGELIGRIAGEASTLAVLGAESEPTLVAASDTSRYRDEHEDQRMELQEPTATTMTPRGRTADSMRITPLARRAASAHGLVAADLLGTGPLGRITLRDVLGKVDGSAPSARSARTPPARVVSREPEPAPRSDAGTRRREPSRVQQVIARRMAEAKATIPHFQVQTEVDMEAALALRREFKALVDEVEALPSINDLIVKAAAVALRRHPLANGSYRDGGFALHDAINVGVAVAVDEALVVPTVFQADKKSLGQIAADTKRLAIAVRSGTITPPDLAGGTFTVSNLGMFGMTAITPVINPPQAAILGVGAARTILARVNGVITERQILTLTLSCDHRILYGADAAQFLAEIRELLEHPLRLVL